MLPTKSLAFRLIVMVGGWSIAGLIAGSFGLSYLFRTSIERSVDNRLLADFQDVIASAEIDCDGTFAMSRPLVTERFTRVYSGSYWQVRSEQVKGGKAPSQLSRSRSLQEQSLPIAKPGALGELVTGYADGPLNQRLRYVARLISIPGLDDLEAGGTCSGDKRFHVTIASDYTNMISEAEEFDRILFLSIMGLGGGLIVAMLILVRWGLSPLNHVSKSLAEIREGRVDRLQGEFPTEIQPLADELNALVKHNAEVVARARTHVGNLAHFLKTPLSVLANEVQGVPGAMAETVARQVQVMRRQVDHYLARARTVASASVLGARCEVLPVVNDITRAISKIYASQGIRLEKECQEGLAFRGDRADLEEMIGNLLDNACKWAEGEVSITVSSQPLGRLLVVVADDGPGLTEEQKQRVLERGERLDESKPGSGLGLGIVREISALYGGHLNLAKSATGGLSAELDLPATDRSTPANA